MLRVCGMNPVIRILYLSGILDHPGIQYEPQINLYNAGGSHIPGTNFVTTNTSGIYNSTGNVPLTTNSNLEPPAILVQLNRDHAENWGFIFATTCYTA